MSAAPRPARWHRRLAGCLGCVTVLLVSLVLVRLTIGWVFPVASSSMWPTLKPHEWVFLRWDRSLPERFDLAAFRSEGGEAWDPLESTCRHASLSIL